MTNEVKAAAKAVGQAALDRLTGKKFAGSIIATVALCFLAVTPWVTGGAVVAELAMYALKCLVAINVLFFGTQVTIDGIKEYLAGKRGGTDA